MTQTLSATLPTTTSLRGAVERAIANKFPADDVATVAAMCVAAGFMQYETQFRAITRSAAAHFAECNWQSSQQDAIDRDQLYDMAVVRTLAAFEDAAGELALDPSFWQAARQDFALQIEGLHDGGLRREFFNSIFRRCFDSATLLSRCGFVPINYSEPAKTGAPDIRRLIDCQWVVETAANELLQAVQIEAQWLNIHASAMQLAKQIETQWARRMTGSLRFMEVLDAVFYRFTRAFVIGRLIGDDGVIPFAVAITNPEGGASVDDLLLGEAEMSDLFRRPHASFQVELEQATDAVSYLRVLTPRLQHRELLAALGYRTE